MYAPASNEAEQVAQGLAQGAAAQVALSCQTK